MNKSDKIREGQSQINWVHGERNANKAVSHLIANLHRGKHSTTWPKNGFHKHLAHLEYRSYTLLQKFTNQLLQGDQSSPVVMVQQKKYLLSLTHCFNQFLSHKGHTFKDTNDFINFIESTKVKKRTFLVSTDVTSLYTNIQKNEGIDTVCKAYDNFYKEPPPPPPPPAAIPTHYLREMLRLILKENSFQFNGKHYLQIHGTAMGTKMAVSFANVFMAKIETEILSKSVFYSLETIHWRHLFIVGDK